MKKFLKQIFIPSLSSAFLFLKLFALKVGAADGIFGKIEPPVGVDKYQAEVGTGEIGIVVFLSSVIRLLTVAAGVWTLFNLIMAGYTYISSSGDAKAHEEVGNKITNSVIGLAIIAMSYTIAALIGYLVFGDATFIISPTLKSVN